ncbi:MAG: hypothetical protein GXP25_22490 [Planctomycetes bacterium]|nr:hypothetical protein [Planctomycetota bacterium]
MTDPAKKREARESKPRNPLRVASLVFFLAAAWFLGSSLYSRCSIAPALGATAADPARRDDARRLMTRATWLVFGGTIFAQRLSHGRVPGSVSSKSLTDVEAEFTAMLEREREIVEKLVMIPDPFAAAKYGPACVRYVRDLKARRAEGKGPSDAEALAAITQQMEYYVTSRMAAQYGEGAAALLLEFRHFERENKLTEAKREELNQKWANLVEKEITDFQQLVMIHGRNGYVFGGFLLLAAVAFLLVSLLGRSFIPQTPVESPS